jgi:multicomponent Na+:H+ antiporter subunit E
METTSRLKQILPFALVLFGLWVVLSGKFDAFHLLLGAGSAFGVSLGTRRLLLLPPAIGPEFVYPFAAIPWLRLLAYLPWLLWQIVLSGLHVAYVVLHPKMPIQPGFIRFRTALPHPLAQLTLATSITLTPGTVTIDVQGDEFVVHALTAATAQALDPPGGNGDMQRWVAAIYATPEQPQPTGTPV